MGYGSRVCGGVHSLNISIVRSRKTIRPDLDGRGAGAGADEVDDQPCKAPIGCAAPHQTDFLRMRSAQDEEVPSESQTLGRATLMWVRLRRSTAPSCHWAPSRLPALTEIARGPESAIAASAWVLEGNFASVITT
jgi:hypothetical protein